MGKIVNSRNLVPQKIYILQRLKVINTLAWNSLKIKYEGGGKA